MLDLADDELIIDNFAGGGGASLGIEMALGRGPDIAINHDAEAVAMHTVNHPHTHHLCEDIWDVKPKKIARKPDGTWHRIALVWLSPDCKHFSKAKGGKPVEKRIRGLAWKAVQWAALPYPAKPRVMMLENVEEFLTWGPLLVDADGNARPDPNQKGREFRAFVNALNRQGFKVEWREDVRACDFGAPTIRKRLLLIARSDGKPIVWPKPTHAPARVSQDGIVTEWARGHGLTLKDLQGIKPYRTAAECIDWSRPCPSIFLNEIEARLAGVKRPLADPTQARIARGLDRFVLKSARPFIIPVTHQSKAGRDGRVHDLDSPLRTITTANRGELALVTPTLVGCGGRAGQSRPRGADEPMATATAKADTCLVTAHLMTMRNAQKPYNEADKPTHTITADGARLCLVTGNIVKFRGDSKGSPLEAPLPTVTAGPAENPAGAAHAMGICTAFLAQHNAGFNTTPGHDAREPLSTVSGKGSQQQVVAAQMIQLRGTNEAGRDLREPAPTIAAEGQHEGVASAYLVKYYGEGGTDQDVSEPMHTATAKARFAAAKADMQQESLLTEEQRYAAWWVARWFEEYVPPAPAAGWPIGVPAPRPAMLTIPSGDGGCYAIVDIGMRMLTARELYRAQGFPDSYVIEIMVPRRIGKRTVMRPLPGDAQNRMCGNSVSPPKARAHVLAQFSTANDNAVQFAEAGE